MLALASSSLSFAPAVRIAPTATRSASVVMETVADLKELAMKCNPTIGFYDPLGIAEGAVAAGTEEATIGWFRHAEIKHGRVAMAAFVGFLVQSNGIVIPGLLSGGPFGPPDIMYSDIAAAGGPADQWDALPAYAKIQIIGAVGILEAIGELSPVLEANGEKHYVKGGKPGYYPPFKGFFNDQYWPHPLPLNLFDPLGLQKKMSPERKAKALVAEINNGRLAMLGIFGMISTTKGLIVPGLDKIEGIKPYAGEYMAPFSAADAATLPLVSDMLEFGKSLP